MLLRQPPIIIAACLAIVTLLGGCGMINGESDYVPYTVALQEHSTAESSRIQTQAQAIADSVAYARTDTKTEKTLLAVIAMMQIERLQPVALNITKPTTGYDVLNNNIAPVIGATLTGALGYFSYDAIKALAQNGGNTFNGSVDATGSFNNVEQHTTYSDGSSSSLELIPSVHDDSSTDTSP